MIGERTGTWRALNTAAASTDLQSGFVSFEGLYRRVCLKPHRANGDSRFAGYLALHLPEVAARIDEADYGILHLEVAALKSATREAIHRRDWHTVGKYFGFVASLLDDAGDDLRGAIDVSYLAALLHGERSLNYEKARTLLPAPLALALDRIERHYAGLTA